MSSKKAAKAAKAAKRSAKLVDAAQAGDVETMARLMSSGGKLDLDVQVIVQALAKGHPFSVLDFSYNRLGLATYKYPLWSM